VPTYCINPIPFLSYCVFSELQERRAHIAAVIESEEKAFFDVFDRALVRFEQALNGTDAAKRVLNGQSPLPFLLISISEYVGISN